MNCVKKTLDFKHFIKNNCNCDTCKSTNKKIILINNILNFNKYNNSKYKYLFQNNINIQHHLNLLEKKHKIIKLLHEDYDTLNNSYQIFLKNEDKLHF